MSVLHHHPGRARRTMGSQFWEHLEHLGDEQEGEDGDFGKGHLLQVPGDPFLPRNDLASFDLLLRGGGSVPVNGHRHRRPSGLAESLARQLEDGRSSSSSVQAAKKRPPAFVRKLSRIFSSGEKVTTPKSRRLSDKENLPLLPRIHRCSLSGLTPRHQQLQQQQGHRGRSEPRVPPLHGHHHHHHPQVPTIRVHKSASNGDLLGAFGRRSSPDVVGFSGSLRGSVSLRNLSPEDVPSPCQRSISRRKILDSLFEEPDCYCEEEVGGLNDDDGEPLTMRPIPDVHRRVRKTGRDMVVSRSELVSSLLLGGGGHDEMDDVQDGDGDLCRDVIPDGEEDIFAAAAVTDDDDDDHEGGRGREPFVLVIFDGGDHIDENSTYDWSERQSSAMQGASSASALSSVGWRERERKRKLGSVGKKSFPT